MSLRRGRLRSDPRRTGATSERHHAISKASDAQRDKARSFGACIACQNKLELVPIDPAHLCPRSHGGCDDPDCIVPLCRWCHRDFDIRRSLDLQPYLVGVWTAELAHALSHYGGDWIALGERLTGQRVVVIEHERALELGL